MPKLSIENAFNLLVTFIADNFMVILPVAVFGMILYWYLKKKSAEPEGYRDWLKDFKERKVKENEINVTNYRWLCRGGKRIGFIRSLVENKVYPVKKAKKMKGEKDKVTYEDEPLSYYKMVIHPILFSIGKIHFPNPLSKKFCLIPTRILREYGDNRLILPFDSDLIEYKHVTTVATKELQEIENVINNYYLPKWREEILENTAANSIIKLSSIVPIWGHDIEKRREEAKIESEKRKGKGVEI